MKVKFYPTSTQLRFGLRNGADSSVELKVGRLVIPQILERDFISQDIHEGDETLVRATRKSMIDLLASEWGLKAYTFERGVSISTSSGTLYGTAFASNITVDEETGDVVIHFRPETYEGAYNALGQGTGYRVELEKRRIESVESTLGNFSSMEQYEEARRKAGLGVLEPMETETSPVTANG